MANTVLSEASHIVTIRYRSGVTTKTQLVFHDGTRDRSMSVTGVHDPDEGHRLLMLACVEVVA